MFDINKDARVLITGGSGLVGKHLTDHLSASGYRDIISPTHQEVDFSDLEAADNFFSRVKPTYVFSLAALVGGIYDNKTRPADFYWVNAQIGNITFYLSNKYLVQNVVCAGAGCGYPVTLPEPLREDDIWDGFPQPESAAYSIAKKTLIIQSEAYNKQYGLNSSVIIPSNIYGEFDNFDLEKSHVIPALVHKFYLATINNEPVKVWGNGEAKRDFLYVKDFVHALEQALQLNGSNLVNVASGEQTSIADVCILLSKITHKDIMIEYQPEMPSGQKSREFSLERVNTLLPDWKCEYQLEDGLSNTFKWFSENYARGQLRV